MQQSHWIIALVLGCGALSLFANYPPRQVEPAVSTSQARSLVLAYRAQYEADAEGGDASPVASALDREIARLQTKIRESEDPNPWLERLGWAFIDKARADSDPGFYVLADQCARAIRASKRDNDSAALLYGHVLHSTHRFSEAEQVARPLTERRGLSFDFSLLGDALMEQGQLEEAAAAYTQMMAIRPDLHAYARAAHLRYLKGDLEGALLAARDAARSASPRSPLVYTWAWSQLARYELELGSIEAARRSSERALERNPAAPKALLVYGRILLSQGSFDEAIVALRLAAQENPEPEFLWTLAEALRSAGQSREATAVEEQLHEVGRDSDPRSYALFLASQERRLDVAYELAQSELLVRRDVYTYDAIAWVAQARGDLTSAGANIKRALAEGTSDPRILFHAAVISSRQGNDSEAESFKNAAQSGSHALLPSERRELNSI